MYKITFYIINKIIHKMRTNFIHNTLDIKTNKYIMNKIYSFHNKIIFY